MSAPIAIRLHPNDNVVVARMDILPGSRVEGDIAAAPTSADGNVLYVFDGAVKTVTIEYTQGNEPPSRSP